MTKEEAKARLNELKKNYETVTSQLEAEMAELALEHNLYLYLGDYGTGRSLLLSDDKYSGRERGEWVSSSETC